MHFKKLFFNVLLITSTAAASGYFQQGVSYEITAELKPSEHMLSYKSIMTYVNNSQDTLKEIYLRLHWNIFKEDSYGRQEYISKRVVDSEITDGIEISSVLINNQQANNNYEIDNTIMKVSLKENLKPGGSITIQIEAKEEVPSGTLRMGRYNRDYAIAHWFPAVCVYDKNGWQIDQYLGQGEFNEEIGNYEVNITVPSSYLVFYTGYLLNSDEVLPQEALKNLNDAKLTGERTRIFDQTKNHAEPDEKITKTWKFKADMVRTFAFAAFENHLWDAQEFEGTMINTVYPAEDEEYYSQKAMKAAVHAVKFFSKVYGKYPYPNVFVAAAWNIGGGMEYPGITFVEASIGISIFNMFEDLTIIHEIGHNWCPMIINSNETKYAFMDEGFTEYWTMKAVEDLSGKDSNLIKPSGLLSYIIPPIGNYTYDSYETVNNQLSGLQEPIMTHSDRYNGSDNYYTNSYFKTACVLNMLRYVMGEEAFLELFKEYFIKFKFKHVCPEDFFSLAEEINFKYNHSKDLSWFFDEWFQKTCYLDYALKDIDYEFTEGKYKTEVTIERVGEAIMPCEVVINLADGSQKIEKFDAVDFFKGPNIVSKSFEYDSKPVRAEIDPGQRLLDVNRLNNSTDLIPRIAFHINPLLDILKFPKPDEYTVYWIPAFSFNNIDGFKLGVYLSGTYFQDRKNIEMTLTQGFKFGKNSTGGDIVLKDKIEPFGPEAEGSLSYFNYEGRRGGALTISKTFVSYDYFPRYGLSVSANYFDAYDDRYFNPLSFDRVTGLASGNLMQRKYFWINSKLSYSNMNNQTSFSSSVNYESGFLALDNKRKNEFQKITFVFNERIQVPFLNSLKLRQYFGYSPDELPAAKSYYIATVNPVEEFSSYIYRTPGIVSNSARQKRSVPNGGGYMRGYFNQNSLGNTITTFNSELSLGFLLNPIPILGDLLGGNTWIFADAGNTWFSSDEIRFKDFLLDYGFSIKIPLRTNIGYGSNLFSFLDKLGISSLNFDFPLYVNKPVPGEGKFKFRWLFGFQSPF